MISGESGTGKELVARALHDYGKRRNGPVRRRQHGGDPARADRIGAFGHERGAFTGAQARSAGRFEQAEGGTLFLDEIGDMPMEAQTRLLRVLQQGEYTTVGGRTPIRTDVRIIAATNKDLRQLIRQGLFREDLFFRLNVVPIRLPPLRERADDIPDLVRHFLSTAGARGAARQDHRAGRARGDAALSLAGQCARARKPDPPADGALSAGDDHRADRGERDRPDVGDRSRAGRRGSDNVGGALERHLARYFGEFGSGLPPPGLYQRILREVEVPLISAALGATRGNQIKAAELLGLNRNTLRKKIRELDIHVMRRGV